MKTIRWDRIGKMDTFSQVFVLQALKVRFEEVMYTPEWLSLCATPELYMIVCFPGMDWPCMQRNAQRLKNLALRKTLTTAGTLYHAYRLYEDTQDERLRVVM